MEDLVETYHCQTGYTHSDEITLIFANKYDKDTKLPNSGEHLFGGRINKIVSEFASFCSLRFTYHLKSLINKTDINKSNYEKAYIYLENPTLNFDARVIVYPEDKTYEIVNHMLWRSMRDCIRNCIAKYADMNFSKKEVFKKNSTELIEMLKTKNINIDDVPIYFKHGVYCKKQEFTYQTDEGVTYIRNKATYRCILIDKYTDEIYNLLIAKKWTDDDKSIEIDIDKI
jgi:tRNA(His) 5'-end guanylyltransferase